MAKLRNSLTAKIFLVTCLLLTAVCVLTYGLGYSKPGVSIAMKKLRENGCISMAADGFITLNDSGQEIARRIYHRHRTLTELFTLPGVSEKNAPADACKVEHGLSEETFARIHDFVVQNRT